VLPDASAGAVHDRLGLGALSRALDGDVPNPVVDEVLHNRLHPGRSVRTAAVGLSVALMLSITTSEPGKRGHVASVNPPAISTWLAFSFAHSLETLLPDSQLRLDESVAYPVREIASSVNPCIEPLNFLGAAVRLRTLPQTAAPPL
jgi:hypothetical protein